MDNVDAAVAAVEAGRQKIDMTVLQGAFGDSGRPFEIAIPGDLTEAEAYALIELITKVRAQILVAGKTSKLVDLTGRQLPMS